MHIHIHLLLVIRRGLHALFIHHRGSLRAPTGWWGPRRARVEAVRLLFASFRESDWLSPAVATWILRYNYYPYPVHFA